MMGISPVESYKPAERRIPISDHPRQSEKG